ncbi:MAG: ABC-F family ATP-binding cassette domain-containing protein [Neisseriaceae bacterium]|nr:ABC-F family ATP-binding cassette domain-containing protein [Neisseriaceae bacterium]MBP6863455.1 ABC-F family ATP-binding cassette domain-containing protein [Neisseriaceae bacterium]
MPAPIMIDAQAVCVQFPSSPKPLFDHLSLSIGRRLHALTGRNGIGKSVLGAVLAKVITPTSGQVWHHGRVGYLPQQTHESAQTVAEAFGVAELLAAQTRLAEGQASEADFGVLAEAGTEGWLVAEAINQRLQAQGLRAGLLTQPMASLSGGEQTKVRLLALLYAGAEVIVLDEPSNHLDEAGVAWLCEWLQASGLGALLITHDERLLAIAEVIDELDELGLHRSEGGWATHQATMAQRQAGAEALLAKQQRAVSSAQQAQQERQERSQQSQSRGKKGRFAAGQSKLLLDRQKNRSEATQGRVNSQYAHRLETALAARDAASEQVPDLDPLGLCVAPLAPAGPIVASASDLVLPYGDQTPLNFTLRAGQKWALLGPNGSGKSTLLAVLAGAAAPQSGQAYATATVLRVDQHFSFLDPQLSALANFMAFAPGLREDEYRTRLAQLRLRRDKALYPLGQLSGGEQLKVALACLFSGVVAPALLLLDEPDNHLDQASRALLGQALNQYQGAWLVVSHRPAFVAALAVDEVLRLQGVPPF